MGAISETVLLLAFGRYQNPLFGLKVMSRKASPTIIVPITVFVVPVEDIDELLPTSVKYKLPLPGLKARPYGLFPLGMKVQNSVCCTVYHVYIAVVWVKGNTLGLPGLCWSDNEFFFLLSLYNQSLQLNINGLV
jgi:hypothetical protein